MKQVLAADALEGEEFYCPGLETGIGIDGHVGGAERVKLQWKTPNDNWVDMDVIFSANGLKAFNSFPDRPYRVVTSVLGVEAWALDGAYRADVIL